MELEPRLEGWADETAGTATTADAIKQLRIYMLFLFIFQTFPRRLTLLAFYRNVNFLFRWRLKVIIMSGQKIALLGETFPYFIKSGKVLPGMYWRSTPFRTGRGIVWAGGKTSCRTVEGSAKGVRKSE